MITLQSFGYKKSGVPQNSQLTIDVRHLPNPHDIPALRELNGTNPLVREYLNLLIPRQEFDALASQVLFGGAEIISIGCTGGKHRSVYVVEGLAALLRKLGYEVKVIHIELEAK
jgi:UPF0042 nucleotide-binding protein